MKYRIFFIVLIVLLLLTGCGGVSRADYDALQQDYDRLAAENAQQAEEIGELTTQLAAKEDAYASLSEQYTLSQVNVLLLRQNLAATYDGYRYLIIDVTNQVYSDGLSKNEWETILTSRTEEMPTYDDIVKLMKD